MVSAIIMAHGDDQGLMLPPRLTAPFQAVVVPIWRKGAEPRCLRWDAASPTPSRPGRAVQAGHRDELSAGFKFNDWEMRGVPLRIEIGPRDVEQNAVVFAAPTTCRARKGKTFGVPVDGVAQAAGHARHDPGRRTGALDEVPGGHRTVRNYDEFKLVLEGPGGFIRVPWGGTGEDEDRIQGRDKAAASRSNTRARKGVCFYTGNKTDRVAIFARAY